MAKAYLGFGSNEGDRLVMMREAVDMLTDGGVTFLRWAPMYETEPIGVFSQGDPGWFLNTVAEVETVLDPLTLLVLIKKIEVALGRVPAARPESETERIYFSRPIDIDLLLYGETVLTHEALTVPHPRFHLRRYDLEPLTLLVPTHIHPVLNKTIAELLAECEDDSVVNIVSESL